MLVDDSGRDQSHEGVLPKLFFAAFLKRSYAIDKFMGFVLIFYVIYNSCPLNFMKEI